MEWEVQKCPDLLAQYAKVLHLDVVKVQLVYKILRCVSKRVVLVMCRVDRPTIIKRAHAIVPIAAELKPISPSCSIFVKAFVSPITPSPSCLVISVLHTISSHSQLTIISVRQVILSTK